MENSVQVGIADNEPSLTGQSLGLLSSLYLLPFFLASYHKEALTIFQRHLLGSAEWG